MLEQAAVPVFTEVAAILLVLADLVLHPVLVLLDYVSLVRVNREASARHHQLAGSAALRAASRSRLADVVLLSPLSNAIVAKRVVAVDQQAERLLRAHYILQANSAQSLLSRLWLHIVILSSVVLLEGLRRFGGRWGVDAD